MSFAINVDPIHTVEDTETTLPAPVYASWTSIQVQRGRTQTPTPTLLTAPSLTLVTPCHRLRLQDPTLKPSAKRPWPSTPNSGQDLLDHPLVVAVERCESLNSISTISEGQSQVFVEQEWLTPLHAISTSVAVSAGASLVRLTSAIFKFLTNRRRLSPVGVFPSGSLQLFFLGLASSSPCVSLSSPSPLLVDNLVCQTAKYVRESYDILVDIFKHIENFRRRSRFTWKLSPHPQKIR